MQEDKLLDEVMPLDRDRGKNTLPFPLYSFLFNCLQIDRSKQINIILVQANTVMGWGDITWKIRAWRITSAVALLITIAIACLWQTVLWIYYTLHIHLQVYTSTSMYIYKYIHLQVYTSTSTLIREAVN